MLDRLIAFSIQHRFFVLLATLFLVVGGLWSASTLPIDAVPDITTNQVVINTVAAGLAPEEVEKQITRPLEIGLSGLPGATEMRSICQFGLSQITVVFSDDTDLYRARQLVGERLSSFKGGVSPEMAPIATGLGEIYYVFVESDRHDLMERRAILDWQVRPRLRTVPGLIEINSFGGQVKQYQVLASPEKLRSYNLTLGQLRDALNNNNRNAGGAYIAKQNEQQLVQGIGMVTNLQDLRDIVLAAKNGVALPREVGVAHVKDQQGLAGGDSACVVA